MSINLWAPCIILFKSVISPSSVSIKLPTLKEPSVFFIILVLLSPYKLNLDAVTLNSSLPAILPLSTASFILLIIGRSSALVIRLPVLSYSLRPKTTSILFNPVAFPVPSIWCIENSVIAEGLHIPFVSCPPIVSVS